MDRLIGGAHENAVFAGRFDDVARRHLCTPGEGADPRRDRC